MFANKLIIRRMSDRNIKPLDSFYVKPIHGLKKYLTNKLFKFFESYEQNFQKRFPDTFRMFRVFVTGSKDLYHDIIQYFHISRELSYGKQVNQFSYKELMTYFQTPKDLMRVGPVVLLSALPLAQYIVFPMAYYLPKQLLSSHYWSLQQRIEFQIIDHTNKLYHYRPVFRHLQKKLPVVTDEDYLNRKCGQIFAKLGSGTHPNVQQILELKQLFIEKPYGLSYLSSRHLSSLCRMHGLNALLGKRARLWNHIGFVHQMDLALVRDGFQSLSLDQIRRACFLRGLNPINLNKEEMIVWLQLWVNIAQNVESNSISLLLHSPILLAYNHPSNWRLIH